MIIIIFILALITVKYFGVFDISWTITSIISAALIAVEVTLYYHKKYLLAVIMGVAQAADNVVGELESQLNDKEDKE